MESFQGLLTDDNGEPVAMIVNPKGTSIKHFAGYPTKLVAPMIKASTSEKGCCPKCGAPWERIVETSPMEIKRSGRGEKVFGNSHSTAAIGTMTKPSGRWRSVHGQDGSA
jgi:hypothetical protein